jgi:UDP-GlcNAc:undecaprenyl-phosphate GlcNAc-1-phosphate transferase
MPYLLGFSLAFTISVLTTPLLIIIAKRLDIIDYPSGRHQHAKPTALLGGLAIFLAVTVTGWFFYDLLVATNLSTGHWLGVLIGLILLAIGGVLDDKFNLKPSQQLIWPILAVFALIIGGVGIEKVTNPFGGLLMLDQWRIPIMSYGGQMHYFMLIADTFTIIWVLGMIYTTKLLDGLDGLVSGLGLIASIIIFAFTQSSRYFQPDISLAAVILAGAILGFLIFNWHPAKIFLGESGAMIIGFLLGVLSIISGGKIAIALLIMGIPILDVAWTIIRRLIKGQNPFKTADRQHLHFRLQDAGLGVRATVLSFYALAIIFGASALFLQSQGKIIAIGVLLIIMTIFIGLFYWLDKKRQAS